MKRYLARAICVMISFCLLLSSCGGGGGDGKSNTAMGRYIEQQLQELENESLISKVKVNEAGDTSFFTNQMNEEGTPNGKVMHNSMKAGAEKMESNEVSWLSELGAAQNFVQHVAEGPDGAVYALYRDAGGKWHIAKSTDGTTSEEIVIPDWQKTSAGGQGGFTPEVSSGNESIDLGGIAISEPKTGIVEEGGGFVFGGDDMGITPNSLAILPNGDILISDFVKGAIRYSAADGTKIMEYLGIGADAITYENKLVQTNQDVSKIMVYDLDTGKILNEYSYEGLSYNTRLAMNEDGVYVADSSGLSRISEGGSVWEKLVDGGLTSMSIPSMGIVNIVPAGKESFYVLYYASEDVQRLKLMNYTYSKDTPTNPDTELTIFGLRNNNTIRQAIGEFQLKNPQVKINYRVGLDDDSSATVEDVIKALNTELLANKAPDLLLLDGLPIDSYIEKGVLSDISGLIEELTGTENLLPNLMKTYQKDGKTYGVPTRFSVPVMIGKNSDLANITSLEALAELVEQGGEVPIINTPTSMIDNQLLEEYYDYNVSSWLSSGKKIDETKLASFLNQILNISKKLKESSDQSGDMGMVVSIASSGGIGEIITMGSEVVGAGKAKSNIQQIGGTGSLGYVLSSIQELEDGAIKSLFGKNEFLPLSSVGVVASSKQQDLAKEFLKTLLSQKVQDQNLGDGLPVNGNSLESSIEKLKVEKKSENDFGFMELCKNLTTPILGDAVIKQSVLSQNEALTNGSITPEDAAKKILENTQLYRTE